MTVSVKLKVTIEVEATVTSDGTVTYAAATDPHGLAGAVQHAVPRDTFVKAYAHKTRSKLDQGVVRVQSSSIGGALRYLAFARLTKLHVILVGQGGEEKFRRRDGRSLKGDSWHWHRIHADDLAAIEKKYGASVPTESR